MCIRELIVRSCFYCCFDSFSLPLRFSPQLFISLDELEMEIDMFGNDTSNVIESLFSPFRMLDKKLAPIPLLEAFQ